MYAIVEIAGQQFKVEEGNKIFTHRLDIEEGNNIDFDKVLLIEDNDKIIIGEPVISEAIVEGKVLEHVRADKVIVFKKKRKKGYRVKNGHRQNLSHVEIINILTDKTGPRKEAPKHEKAEAKKSVAADETAPVKKVSAKKEPAKKAAVKKEAKAEVAEKKPAVKKAAEKKPAVKKAAEKKTPKGEKK